MGALEHRGEEVAQRNPLRRLPVLELDDGTIITESIAICRYFEELHPEPALFGRGALGKAKVEMWQRRLELN
ncbi:MAG: glutathione S-transferase, partial [Mesorhizobium sp.]|uniref:glutathione S-transferase family protein n=1 Tax=Mesorhizobium sp. TaxID=1871066 RepID=UPI00120752BD